MNKNMLNKIFVIAWTLLSLAGIILLCISIFSDNKTTTPLAIALGCIALSNLLNLIRLRINKKNEIDKAEFVGGGLI